jgi:hypothetical protein
MPESITTQFLYLSWLGKEQQAGHSLHEQCSSWFSHTDPSGLINSLVGREVYHDLVFSSYSLGLSHSY